MQQDKVARLRQLMAEAVPAKSREACTEEQALHLFHLHEFNTGTAELIATSPRAKALREIDRISNWYGWRNEIVRCLDRNDVSSTTQLSDSAVEALLERMKTLEDCVREGLDCPDAPPAR